MPTLDRAELDETCGSTSTSAGGWACSTPRWTGAPSRAPRSATAARSPHKNTRLITASFAAGWMEAALEEQVNLVNAEVLAKERGIAIVEEKIDRPRRLRHDDPDRGRDRARRPTSPPGTLFGKQFLRLVRLGPYRLDAHLDGTLLIFTHRDVPGLIGFIGTTFGRHGVNIAQMNVGREQTAGGEAIGVVNLDSVPPEAALEEVRRHPDILSVSLIKLPEARRSKPTPWLSA